MSRRSGRPRTGSLEPYGTHRDGSPRFRYRLRLADGTKSERFDVDPGLTETQARAFVAGIQAREDAHGLLLARKREGSRLAAAEARKPHEAEAWDDWFARYLKTKECGEGWRSVSESIANKWISPVIGTKPVRSLTRDDVEDVRDKLDAAVSEQKVRAGTAHGAWAVLTSALKAAYASRDRTLRVHPTPLHFGILPPKRGEPRQRPWLYPREWLALAASVSVPREFRQICAIALYTGLRPGELRALTWDDVDLQALSLSVSKAMGPDGEIKVPKTAQGQRVIPLHAHLVPLLTALKAKGGAMVASFPAAEGGTMAGAFRDHLTTANVTRPRLTADNATEEPIDFRSLRDTHATWLALAGTPDKVVQRRLGHADPSTTDRYVKAAETFASDNVGEPFPPLPADLLTVEGPAVWPKVWPKEATDPKRRWKPRGHKTEKVLGSFELRTQSGREDSNLRPLDPQSSALTRLRYAPGHHSFVFRRPFGVAEHSRLALPHKAVLAKPLPRHLKRTRPPRNARAPAPSERATRPPPARPPCGTRSRAVQARRSTRFPSPTTCSRPTLRQSAEPPRRPGRTPAHTLRTPA